MAPILELSLNLHTRVPVLIEGVVDSTTEENTIDRSFLVDIAPDREVLLRGRETSIRSIRDALKLNSVDLTSEHWLLKTTEQHNVRVRNDTRRLSRLPWKLEGSKALNLKNNACNFARRLSGTSIPITHQNKDSLRLSTADVLVSPRPLGPTHTLVLYSDRPSPTGKYSRIVEMPIDDLLFAVHCPNLRLSSRSQSDLGDEAGRVLVKMPHRQLGVLPKVLLRVPDLDTFPALVVYMHTRNQASLFRMLTPEWFRDEMLDFAQGKSSQSFNNVARAIAERGSCDELVRIGSIINGLRFNLLEVGLKEQTLDRQVDLFFRLLVRAINFKALASAKEIDTCEVDKVTTNEVPQLKKPWNPVKVVRCMSVAIM